MVFSERIARITCLYLNFILELEILVDHVRHMPCNHEGGTTVEEHWIDVDVKVLNIREEPV